MVTLAAAGMAASCDHAPRTADAVTAFMVDVTGISDIAEFADITGIVVTASLCRALRQRTTGHILGGVDASLTSVRRRFRTPW